MTLFHLFAIILYSLFVIVLSKFFGLEPWSVGFVGAICILIVWSGFGIYREKKAHPKCQNPECKASRYKMIGWAKDIGIADPAVVFECKQCGDKYLLTPKNFMKLDKNNQPFKYMKRLASKGKWEMDDYPHS